jgi:hypothetical protein
MAGLGDCVTLGLKMEIAAPGDRNSSWSWRQCLICASFCLVSAPGRDEFNIQVLHAFVELHEFTDLNLVQALRCVSSRARQAPLACLSMCHLTELVSLGMVHMS